MKNGSAQKLTDLRAEMKQRGLDGFIIPRISEYQGEFVAEYAERLAWLTGFSGSAGTAIILQHRAVILTDGRYTIQLAQQADKNFYEFENSQKITPPKWLAENGHGVFGYDPWLMTTQQVEQLEKSVAEKNIKLTAVSSNPVDAIWKDRPAFPMTQAEIFPQEFAGVSSQEKRKNAAALLRERNLSACVITMPDSLAWLLNIRGGDVEHTPVILSFGILHQNAQVEWFVHSVKIPAAIKAHLGDEVKIFQPDEMGARLKALNGQVGLDFTRSPIWFRQQLGKDAVDFKDPCIDPKAIKNTAEQTALRAAHIRDGVALVNFLYWLEHIKDKLTEMDIVKKLEEFRRVDKAYRGPSFSTISGWAKNGAIVHYRATEETNAKITPPGLLLLDSGGQYNDGTTDITRTIAIGTPTAEMKKNFTLVLKGHIAVARAKFPQTASGAQIDALARQPLQSEGLDYAHGTGHGVGCFLSVHEESSSLSPRGTESLKSGMFLSNEPGFYKEGEYGIRIENLVLVREEGSMQDGHKMLKFETFSLVPIDRSLIDASLLNDEERKWLNDYHALVIEKIGPHMDKKIRAWLEQKAAPL